MKSVCCIACFIFIPELAFAQLQCLPVTRQCEETTSGLRAVYEVVPSVFDGTTTTYQLHALPSPKGETHFSRAGKELIPMSDYTMEGRSVRLTGRSSQPTDDEIAASYFIDTEVPGKVEAAKPWAASQAATEAKLIVSRFLEDSLKSPTDVRNHMSKEEPPVEREKLPGATEGVSRIGSLRMLSRALSRSGQIASEQQRGSKTGHLKVAVGVEGYGDNLVDGPFDLLADTPGGIKGSLEVLDLNSGGKRRTVAMPKRDRVPRSLSMLQADISQAH